MENVLDVSSAPYLGNEVMSSLLQFVLAGEFAHNDELLAQRRWRRHNGVRRGGAVTEEDSQAKRTSEESCSAG